MKTEVQLEPEGGLDASRREALVKMGRFAAYTAPAMTALLLSNRAVAVSAGGGKQKPPKLAKKPKSPKLPKQAQKPKRPELPNVAQN